MRLFLLPCILVARLTLAGPALAAKATFQLKSRITYPPEMGEVRCYDITSSLGQFTFRPPADWWLEVKAKACQFTLHSPKDDAHVEVRLAGVNSALSPKPDHDALRRQVLERYRGARVIEQFPVFTSVSQGQAFAMVWNPAKGVRTAIRLALVPCPGGTLEFCLTAAPDAIESHRHVFSALLTSFCEVVPKGKEEG